MRLDEFTQLETCPSQLPPALQALWFDQKGDWNRAHEIVQNANDSDSHWVHAYLHRKEGDRDNARYWYRRCGHSEFKASFNQEWEKIVLELLIKL